MGLPPLEDLFGRLASVSAGFVSPQLCGVDAGEPCRFSQPALGLGQAAYVARLAVTVEPGAVGLAEELPGTVCIG
jgi:hypothetical protein